MPQANEITLWGKVYSVEETTDLYLPYDNLTGSIPSEIGVLISMKQ